MWIAILQNTVLKDLRQIGILRHKENPETKAVSGFLKF
jgi:hypothetical protein